MLMLSFLSLHAAGAVAAHELGDVGDGDAVEIAGDAVLQAAGCNCKLECRLLVLIMVKAINQTAREAVTAAQPFQSALWLSRSVMAMHFMFG